MPENFNGTGEIEWLPIGPMALEECEPQVVEGTKAVRDGGRKCGSPGMSVGGLRR